MIRRFAPLAFLFCGVACVVLTGCAAPGDPTPPRQIIPVAISNLSAHQSGSDVRLTFDLPRQSTDREPLAESPAVEIYRTTLSPGSAPDRKTPWRLVYTIPPERTDSYLANGHIEFRDPLSKETVGTPTGVPLAHLAYMVRTRASKRRASDDSNLVVAAIYPVPDAPADLRASVAEHAILLAWSKPASTDNNSGTPEYRVYRSEVERIPDAQPPGKVELKTPLVLLDRTSLTQFQDTHFEFGHTYLYNVHTAVAYGADSIESNDSPESSTIVVPRDTFPPAAPIGLEAAIIPATTSGPASVELSWAISPEPDLAGYHVYRSERDDTLGERIDAEMLSSPTFRDTMAASGRHYSYRIAAVDGSGNESTPSAPVAVDIAPSVP